MLAELSSLGDPAAEGIDLSGREPGPLGGHSQIGLVGGDAGEDLAGGIVAGHDRPRAAVEFTRGGRSVVESQAAFLRIGTVAGVASLGQQRLDLAREVDRFGAADAGRSRGGHDQADDSDGSLKGRSVAKLVC